MYRTMIFAATLTIFTVSSIMAKPVIEFDTKEYDCGTFAEGTKDKIDAVFTVKNTGDDTLKLTSVKPSCGCTVVKFDSLVLPGQSTRINSTVTIKGKKGSISKMITVFSNAENDSIARLIIKTTITEAIALSLSYIDMSSDSAKASLLLTTSKKNLKITDVSFVPESSAAPADSTKKKNSPASVSFTLVPADSSRSDGMVAYRLELVPVTTIQRSNGEFVISTNHPDRKELRIRGKAGK